METRFRRKSDLKIAGDYCNRFGAVAVRKKFSTVEQVKTAIMEQFDDDVNGREHRHLSSILYDKGWITEDQIQAVLVELRNTMG